MLIKFVEADEILVNALADGKTCLLEYWGVLL